MGFTALPAGRAQKIGPGGLELFNVKLGGILICMGKSSNH